MKKTILVRTMLTASLLVLATSCSSAVTPPTTPTGVAEQATATAPVQVAARRDFFFDDCDDCDLFDNINFTFIRRDRFRATFDDRFNRFFDEDRSLKVFDDRRINTLVDDIVTDSRFRRFAFTGNKFNNRIFDDDRLDNVITFFLPSANVNLRLLDINDRKLFRTRFHDLFRTSIHKHFD